jgi:hypothetical protein
LFPAFVNSFYDHRILYPFLSCNITETDSFFQIIKGH